MVRSTLFHSREVEEGKRIRAILYCEDKGSRKSFNNGIYFLLLKRNSEKSMWEFIKGGVNENESIEKAFYRETKEESGITKEHFIGEPKLLNIESAIPHKNKIQKITTYLVKVPFPPKEIILSKEHSGYDWCTGIKTLEVLSRNYHHNRMSDRFIFPSVLKKEFPDLVRR